MSYSWTGRKFWLGGTTYHSQGEQAGTWAWLDGSPFDQVRLDKYIDTQYKYRKELEEETAMQWANGKWVEESMIKRNAFVCKKDPVTITDPEGRILYV